MTTVSERNAHQKNKFLSKRLEILLAKLDTNQIISKTDIKQEILGVQRALYDIKLSTGSIDEDLTLTVSAQTRTAAQQELQKRSNTCTPDASAARRDALASANKIRTFVTDITETIQTLENLSQENTMLVEGAEALPTPATIPERKYIKQRIGEANTKDGTTQDSKPKRVKFLLMNRGRAESGLSSAPNATSQAAVIAHLGVSVGDVTHQRKDQRSSPTAMSPETAAYMRELSRRAALSTAQMNLKNPSRKLLHAFKVEIERMKDLEAEMKEFVNLYEAHIRGGPT